MRLLNLLACLVPLATSSALTYSQEASARLKGDLKLTCNLITDNLQVLADSKDETLVVNQDGQLKNAVIWLVSKKGDPILVNASDYSSNNLIAYSNFSFDPHVITVLPGDELPIKHKCDSKERITFTIRRSKKNIVLHYNETVKFKAERPGFYMLDVTDWPIKKHPQSISSWIIALPTKYVAVSDSNGTFTMKDIPIGEYELRFWHERIQLINKVVHNDKSLNLKDNHLDVQIIKGENDFGVIGLPLSQK